MVLRKSGSIDPSKYKRWQELKSIVGHLIKTHLGLPCGKGRLRDSVLTAFRILLLYVTTGSEPFPPRITGVTMLAPLGELGILGVLGLLGTLEPMTAPPARRVIPNKALPMPELLPGRTLGDVGCWPGRIGLAGMENKR